MLNSSAHALPEPGEAEKKHSLLLKQCIKEACSQAGGWIGFAEYMNIALYQPGLGYYTSGSQKFGAKGDFITAPEVSPLFGQCLANQVSEVLDNFNNDANERAVVLEFGAGSGVLAVDILLELERLGSLPEQYLIIELSAELKHRQQQILKEKVSHLFERVQWLDRLPENIGKAVVIANEVLDAMPVECFRFHDHAVESLMVGVENDELIARYANADSKVVDKLSSIQQRSEIEFAEGYCSEYNPSISGWLSALDSEVDTLAVLVIDYGYSEREYYHADRTGGTLMCYYQHRAHDDFLWWPGLQDITAFVNFTDVAYCAVELDMEVCGYTTQAAFLLANGLSELHAAQVTDDARQQIKLSQQIKTLTLPSEMGERFKVMALTKNYEEPLQGFSMLDLRNRL